MELSCTGRIYGDRVAPSMRFVRVSGQRAMKAAGSHPGHQGWPSTGFLRAGYLIPFRVGRIMHLASQIDLSTIGQFLLFCKKLCGFEGSSQDYSETVQTVRSHAVGYRFRRGSDGFCSRRTGAGSVLRPCLSSDCRKAWNAARTVLSGIAGEGMRIRPVNPSAFTMRFRFVPRAVSIFGLGRSPPLPCPVI